MPYRPDIDGMRTLAVIPVVIYHLALRKLAPGGFVGVDIFFVISGYLITGLIFKSVFDGTFSVADFYYRRIRRILPALAAVYLVSLLLALVLLFPGERATIGEAILSSIAFSSNIYFYSIAGYFDDTLKMNPLLHTWSLSVEEQFYFLIPPIMLLLSRWGRHAVAVALAVVALASLIAAIVVLPRDGSAVFYLLPFRAWELLVGSLLAIGAVPLIRQRWAAELASLAGLALIAGSVMLLTPATPFPGLAALPVVIGTALIIHAGSSFPKAGVNRLLAIGPMRFVGLISYSLYLWHWPIIVFYPYVFGYPTLAAKVVMFGMCFVVAVLSWRFIEQPFRHGSSVRDRKRVYAVAGLSMAAIATTAARAPILIERLRPTPPAVAQVLAQQEPPADLWREDQCFLTSRSQDVANFDHDTCLKTVAGQPNVLLLGDSHAAQYYEALRHIHPDVNLLQANSSGCRPVATGQFDDRCRALMRFMLDDFLKGRRQPSPIDTVLIAGRWLKGDAPLMGDLVRRLRGEGYRVVVIGPVPEYQQPLPRLAAIGIMTPSRRPSQSLDGAIRGADIALGEAVERAGGIYRSPYRLLCRAGECQVWVASGQVMQFDYGHLTLAGARDVVRRLDLPLR